MKKLKYYFPAIIWMIFIFIMSHANGQDSSSQSNFIAEIILKNINIDITVLTFIIRKMAHMVEYAILFALIYYGLSKTTKPSLWLALLISFLYACSDEFHQLFVAGRSGQIKDVLIDTSGAFIMLLIFYIWKKSKSIK